MSGQAAAAPAKMLKMMGLQVKDLVASCVRTPEGTIARQEHGMFWQQVVKPREATDFLVQVLDQLKGTIEKKQTGVGPAALVNTIAFICLFLRIDPNNIGIKQFLKDWKKSRDGLIKEFPPVERVVRNLQLLADSTDMIGPYVIGCSTLHTADQFLALTNTLTFPSYEDNDITSGENCFLFQSISRLANDPTHRLSILKHILNKMMTLPQQMKVNPIVAHSTFLALILMLKHILAKEPLPVEILNRAICTVQPFFLWPKPYGTAAREVLEILQMELLAPGYAMRLQLNKEAMCVDRGQTLLYFMDTSKRAISFAITNELKEYIERRKSGRDAPKVPLPPLTQAMIIMGMMHNEPAVGLSPAEIEMFRKLTRDSVGPLYEKFETYTENVPKNFQQAKQARIDVLNAIKVELKKISSAPGDGLPLQYPEKLINFTPPTIEVDHLAVSCDLKYTFESAQNMKLMLSKRSKFVPYPGSEIYDKYFQILSSYSSKTRQQKHTLRLVVAGGDRLLHVFLCAHMRILQSEPHILKGLDVRFFLIPVETNHLASYIARFDSWYNRHVYIPFRSRAFILPGVRVEESDHFDSKEPASSEGKQQCLPGQYYRGTIMHYTLESRFRWDINVYQCECWLDEGKGRKPTETSLAGPGPTSTSPTQQTEKDTKEKSAQPSTETPADTLPDYNIPFIQSVELGIGAVAQDYLEAHPDMDPNRSIDDVSKERDFIYAPPVVSVQFTKVDLNGRTQRINVEENIQYETIMVANVPKKSDKRVFPPDPTAPWLEMYAKNKSQAGNPKKNILISDAKQHVVSLEVVAVDGGSFEIVIDGQLFRGLKKIHISRIYTVEGDEKSMIWNGEGKPKGSPAIFPVEGFFPVED